MLEGWPPPLFDPAGPYAWSVTALSWALLGVGLAVFLLVVAALLVALFGKPALRERLGGTRLIWAGGIVLPAVVLTILLVWGLSLTRSLSGPVPEGAIRVRVTGEMWWWRVAYLDGSGRTVAIDANELHIPAGRPIALELESADVIHSFWVPRLSGKLDMIPGRRNVMVIQADLPGVYGGQCAEYCGGPHALMGFSVIAHRPDRFARLLDRRRLAHLSASVPSPGAVSPASDGSAIARGSALFGSAGCAACHRVAGTGYNGVAGPDLSHVGSRRTLGAGILPNNRGTLMGWIGNSQAIKPGNRMPAYPVLSGDQLADLAAYLDSRK